MCVFKACLFKQFFSQFYEQFVELAISTWNWPRI